jgi:hypothetical protein
MPAASTRRTWKRDEVSRLRLARQETIMKATKKATKSAKKTTSTKSATGSGRMAMVTQDMLSALTGSASAPSATAEEKPAATKASGRAPKVNPQPGEPGHASVIEDKKGKPKAEKPAKAEKKAKAVPMVGVDISGPLKIECQYKGDTHRATLYPDGSVNYNGVKVTPQRAMKLACDMPWSPTQQTAWRGWRVAEGDKKGQAIGDLRGDGQFHSKPKAEKTEEPKAAKPAKKAKKSKAAK